MESHALAHDLGFKELAHHGNDGVKHQQTDTEEIISAYNFQNTPRDHNRTGAQNRHNIHNGGENCHQKRIFYAQNGKSHKGFHKGDHHYNAVCTNKHKHSVYKLSFYSHKMLTHNLGEHAYHRVVYTVILGDKIIESNHTYNTAHKHGGHSIHNSVYCGDNDTVKIGNQRGGKGGNVYIDILPNLHKLLTEIHKGDISVYGINNLACVIGVVFHFRKYVAYGLVKRGNFAVNTVNDKIQQNSRNTHGNNNREYNRYHTGNFGFSAHKFHKGVQKNSKHVGYNKGRKHTCQIFYKNKGKRRTHKHVRRYNKYFLVRLFRKHIKKILLPITKKTIDNPRLLW